MITQFINKLRVGPLTDEQKHLITQVENHTFFYRANTAMAVSVIYSIAALFVGRANFQVSESYLQKYHNSLDRDCLG